MEIQNRQTLFIHHRTFCHHEDSILSSRYTQRIQLNFLHLHVVDHFH